MSILKDDGKSVKSRIIAITIPSVISQITNTVYAIVDRLFIGKIPNASVEALSGIGICFPIFILISSFSQLLAVGGSTMISMFLGDRKTKWAEKTIGNTISLSIIVSTFLFMLLELKMKPILIGLGASKAAFIYAHSYLKIYLFGIWFQILIQIFASILICQGYAYRSMLACLISAFINIVLDYYYIFVLNKGIEGAALASVISQIIGVAILIVGALLLETRVKLSIRDLKIEIGICERIVRCGISSFVMSFTETCIHSVYNKSLQLYGSDIYIAAMAIIQSLMQIIYVFSNGLTQAVQPTLSYYYGAKDTNSIKSSYRMGIVLHITIAVLGSFSLIMTRKLTASFFTNDKMVINAVCAAVPIYLAGWSIFGIQSGVQCFFVGLGKVKYSMYLAIFRKIILLIPIMLFLPSIIGIKGVFMSEAISDTLAGIFAGILFLHKKEQMIQSPSILEYQKSRSG